MCTLNTTLPMSCVLCNIPPIQGLETLDHYNHHEAIKNEHLIASNPNRTQPRSIKVREGGPITNAGRISKSPAYADPV